MARLIKTDRNGTRYYEGMVQCDRCAGRGGAEAWKFTGYTCYKCGGTGEIMAQWKEYTPEYQAKLDAKRAAKAAKAQAEWEAEEAQREAERMEREAREAEERAQQEAAEAARKAISQYIGNVGDKISATVTLEREISIEVPSFGGWGTTTMRIWFRRTRITLSGLPAAIPTVKASWIISFQCPNPTR